MEIVKPGNIQLLKKEKYFVCNRCRCEFYADNTEYQYGGSQYNIAYYKCTCPTCGQVAYSED